MTPYSVITRYTILGFGLLCALVLAAVLIVGFIVVSYARDLDGRYAQSDLLEWFNKLHATGSGIPCCSFADGWSIDDADWTIEGDHYRVRIEGAWYDVPEGAVVKEPNRLKPPRAVVWPYKSANEGAIQVRCFMPGTEG